MFNAARDDLRKFENLGQISDQVIFDLTQRDLATENLLHRRNRLALAGDDPVEITKVGVYIERESVRRYPTLYVYADRGDLSGRRVNTRQSIDPKRLNTEITHRTNQHFLKIANIKMNIFLV